MGENRQLNEKEYLEYIERWKIDNKDLIDSGKCKKVFLECLPNQNEYSKKRIDWNNTVGESFYFICKNIEGFVKIVKYNKQNQKITLAYDNNTQDIAIASVQKCKLQILLNITTHDYYYSIGDKILTTCGSVEILDKYIKKDKQGYKRKWYKYRCLKCGNIHEIIQGSLKNGNGCNVCSGLSPIKTLKGYNDIATTHPHLIKYFKNIEDSYTHTHGSEDSICLKCPDCSHERIMRVSSLSYYGFSCKKCSDGISYPEKIMFNVLEQLEIDFETHKTFHWSNNIQVDDCKLSGRKEYDCYISSLNIIIETHGRQHYEQTGRKSARTLKQEKENDKLKKELALRNGIKPENYIVIDCRKSELEFIKNNILNSRLNQIFDLSNIDWLKAEEFTCSNLVKIACEYKNNNPQLSATFIADKMGLDICTVIKYLKKGTKLGWCIYKTIKENTEDNIQEACQYWNSGIHSTSEIGKIMKVHYSTIIKYLKQGANIGLTTYDAITSQNNNNKNSGNRLRNINSKEIISLTTGQIFESATECARVSVEVLGIKLTQSGIQRVCSGERRHYKNFLFKYTSDLTEDQIKEIQEDAKLKQVI